MKNLIKILLGITLSFVALLSVAQNKALTFATEATYPPFESLDTNGQMQGFDIEIIKALCAQMKTQCTFTNQAFDSLIPSLQLGKFDAIFGAMNITPARQQQVDFTDPYYANTASVVTVKDKAEPLAKGLEGKTVGVQSGTTLAQYLQDTYGNKVTVNTYASEQSAFLDLTSGRIDAVMGDTPLIKDWVKKNNNGNYVIVGKPISAEKYFGKGYGIAVKKGNTTLLQALNKALAEIKANGTYAKIVQKYFGND